MVCRYHAADRERGLGSVWRAASAALAISRGPVVEIRHCCTERRQLLAPVGSPCSSLPALSGSRCSSGACSAEGWDVFHVKRPACDEQWGARCGGVSHVSRETAIAGTSHRRATGPLHWTRLLPRGAPHYGTAWRRTAESTTPVCPPHSQQNWPRTRPVVPSQYSGTLSTSVELSAVTTARRRPVRPLPRTHVGDGAPTDTGVRRGAPNPNPPSPQGPARRPFGL